MTRIERILQQARLTLADKYKERWSDDDLISILSEGHRDLCLHSNVLMGTIDVPLVEGATSYILPDDFWLLTRATYDGAVLPLVSHHDMDDATLAKFNIDYGINVATDAWELYEGSPKALLYTHRNTNEVCVFPIPDESILTNIYELTGGDFGVTTNVYGMDASEVLGVETSPVLPNVEQDSDFGVSGTIPIAQPNFIRCSYVKVPDHITEVTDALLSPAVLDTALKYYVVGHAFMHDLNQEYQAKGVQQLGFYERELQRTLGAVKKNSARAAQYSTPYRGAF